MWQVTVDRGTYNTTALYSAPTRSKARAEAWRHAHDVWDISFGDFQKVSTVRPYAGPTPDCYGYVRRAYGVEVEIGDRVSVRGERDGEVVHPGSTTTAHVHVLFDGRDFAMPVHPRDITARMPAAAAPPAAAAVPGAPIDEIPF